MNASTTRFNFSKVSPDGMTARVLLAFLATAGLYYVNIMPALVDGLKEGLGFSNRDAGLVGSANMYGAACGAFLIAFVIRYVHPFKWRISATILLFSLMGLDTLSIMTTLPPWLLGVRFMHGLAGGALVGLGFSIIARTVAPDRTFGMLLLVQALAGGAGVMALPLLVPLFGTRVLFITLILFSIITLVMLQFLPDYPERKDRIKTDSIVGDVNKQTIMLKPFLLALASVFLFQAGNMALYAFMIGLGKSLGLDVAFISETLGIANWFGVLGALLVIMLSTRFGIFKPILIGMLLTIAGTWALHYSDIKWLWVAANILTGITWNFVIAYLLGMCARFDQSGQSAVWAGFASKMGLATGPTIGAFMLVGSQYANVIYLSVGLLFLACLAASLPALLLDRRVMIIGEAEARV